VDTSDEDPSNQLLGSSITYRIAVSPQQGRKVFTLHAGVASKAKDRNKLERLCRYITRPAVSTKRLSIDLHVQLIQFHRGFALKNNPTPNGKPLVFSVS